MRQLTARPQSSCVVCGPDHPRGLRIRFELGADRAATASWTPTPEWEGFRGIVHGGILSTVLDEAMSKAVAATQGEALTGELRVRFRRPVQAGDELRIRGWVVERKKRMIRAEASLTGAGDEEFVHAWAAFLALPRRAGQNKEGETSDNCCTDK
jgi:acyl-coenzyme A thioesterase PaaI-like protein